MRFVSSPGFITTGEETYTYGEDSVLAMTKIEGEFHHTDRNTLKRVGTYDLPVE